ncbi:MAG: hypothetical protein WBC44_00435, partial [Planctomycetaceae bacterium]
MDRREQQTLYETDKAATLRRAVDQVPALTRVIRANIERLVSLYEAKSYADGVCKLSRPQVCEQLRWSRTKLGEMRRLAEALGWIEVVRGKDDCGGDAVNLARVCWGRITRDARAMRGSDPPGSETDPPGSETDPPRAAPIKELNSHDHDHESLKPNTHDHCHPPDSERAQAGDAKLPSLKPEQLRDPAYLDRLRPRIVRCYGLPDGEAGRQQLHAAARQALAGTKPGGLFRRICEHRGWTLAPGNTYAIDE